MENLRKRISRMASLLIRGAGGRKFRLAVLALCLFLASSCRPRPETPLPTPPKAPSFSPSSPVLPSPKTPGMTRINMKSYGNHDATYDARILKILPEYVVDNTPHGLWGEIQGHDNPLLLQDPAKYQAAGIRVIGYLTGGYEGQGCKQCLDPKWYSLEMNKTMIKNMAELDKVDGVFIDECTAFPNSTSRAYLRELTTFAHSLGLITWGNTGLDDFDPWYFTDGGFDFMQSTEDWQGQPLTGVQREWGCRISVTGFRPYYTAEDAFRLTVDAWEKGIAFCYINNNEYQVIAPWFEEYAAKLRDYAKTTAKIADSPCAYLP